MAGKTLGRGDSPHKKPEGERKKPREGSSKTCGSTETQPTDQQWVFIRAYIACNFRVGPAAREAGYSVFYARQLMVKAHIQREIAKLIREKGRKYELTADRVIRELCSLAFVNHADISRLRNRVIRPGSETEEPETTVTVDFTDTDDLDEDTQRAISEMAVDEKGVKVKTHDKVKALQLLMMHLGMLEKGQGNTDPKEHARKIQEALVGIDGSVSGV